MRCNEILFVAAIFLCSSAVALGQQASTAPALSQPGNQTSADSAKDCSVNSNAPREAEQAAVREQRPPQAQSDPAGESETADAAPSAVNLEQDLKILEQRQSGLAQCILAANVQEPVQDSQGACFGELLMNFEMRHDGEPERDIPIGRLSGSSAFFYESGMTIDADGAPNAYHPDNKGLDDLANAGTPGRWEGLAKDSDGRTYHPGAGRSVSRLLRFGYGAGRSFKACERSHALRGCVEDSFRGAARRNGSPTGSAPRRFRGRFQSAKRQEFLRDFRRCRAIRPDRRRLGGARRKPGDSIRRAKRRRAERHSVSRVSRLRKRKAADDRGN